MKEHPILFSTPMVQAILDERKTMTRRVCKNIASYDFEWGLDKEPYIGNYQVFTKTEPGKWDWVTLENQWLYDLQTAVDDSRTHLLKSPLPAGDRLWVRETWMPWGCTYCQRECYGSCSPAQYAYKATGDWDDEWKWRPSIHMPKEAARIWLEVTNVRVERLQDITEKDALSEGIKMPSIDRCLSHGGLEMVNIDGWWKDEFKNLWNSTIKKQDLQLYGWNANPWAWVIEFKRLEVVA